MKEFLATRSGTAPGRAKDQILDHFVTNVLAVLDDRSHARVHGCHLCTHTTPVEIDPQFDRIIVGRYFDGVVRTPDGWKIKHRDAGFDWSISIPAGGRPWARHVDSEHNVDLRKDRRDPFFTRSETRRTYESERPLT